MSIGKSKSRKYHKPLIIGLTIAAVVLMAGGVLLGHYFGWFTQDPLKSGPVVVTPQPEPAPKPSSVPYKIEPWVKGLYVPWSLVFTGNDRALVSERSGAIRVIVGGTLADQSLINFSEVSTQEEEGLMGLALDPDYSKNKLVYACYATPSGGALIDKVVRFEDRGTTAGEPQVIVSGIPSAQNHAGCRLGFGPDDKKLYITTGDATQRAIAQDLNSLGGKILRTNPDGSVPSDNPFAGSPVWSLGHRNPQGIAWQPGTGDLYATEHGPSIFDGPAGGDEVNRITKGGNYGWPIVSHERTDSRFVSPLIVFTPAVAPGGATFYTHDVLPQFKGNLLFAGLKGEGLYRVVFASDEPSKILQYEKLPDVAVGRVRDVVDGPDGNLYFMTSNRDGRGRPRTGDDTIYRLVPAQ